jgi:hypothetical protein
MWDFARKNWKTNIAFQAGRTTKLDLKRLRQPRDRRVLVAEIVQNSCEGAGGRRFAVDDEGSPDVRIGRHV